MFAAHDLHRVNQKLDELRRDAAQHRLAARINKQEKSRGQARRVLGLRLSLA